MHRMERENRFASNRLRPGDPEDLESYKTRRGKVGGYRDCLSPASIDWIDRKIESELSDSFGYSSCRTIDIFSSPA